MRFNSRWDASTWAIICLVMACCIAPCFLNDGYGPVIISCVMLAFILITFRSIYYVIDGDSLIVHQLFTAKSYPIMKIKDVKPTDSVLSAPASSLKHRIAIRFIDKSVLKSTIPLIISPVRQTEFLAKLKEINPEINIDEIAQ